MKKPLKAALSAVLALGLAVQTLPFLASEKVLAQEETQVVAVKAENGGVRTVFSDDFEGDTPTIGTRSGGTVGFEAFNKDFGRSLRFNSGSGQTYFRGSNVSDDSYMDIISFDIYSDGLERIYFDLLRKDEKGNDLTSNMLYLTESGKSGLFGSYWNRSVHAQRNFNREIGKWYQYDICIDYRDWTLYLYVNNELIEKRNMPDEDYTEDYKIKFDGFKMYCESYKGGTTSYMDNVRYYQVIQPGIPVNLDKDCFYVENVGDETIVEVDTKTIGSIYFSRDFEYDIKLPNEFDEEKSFTVSTKVLNTDGAVTTPSETKEITVAPKSTGVLTFNGNTDMSGYGTIVVDVASKSTDWTKHIEWVYSSLNGPDKPNPRFFLNDHTGGNVKATGNGMGLKRIDEKFELMKKMGCIGLRSGSAPMVYSIPAPGAVEVPEIWGITGKKLHEHDMIQQIVVSGSHKYANTEWPPRTAAGIKLFTDYWVEIAKKDYAEGRNVHYQIGNELNHGFNTSGATVQEYVELLKVIYPALKAANPNGTVWGMSGVTYVGNYFDWIEEFLKLGGPEYCDGLDYHPYRPGVKAINCYNTVIETEALFKKYGYEDKPIVFSEVGYTSSGTTTEQRQMNWTVQASAMINDYYDQISWYVNQEKWNTGETENHFGWIRAWEWDYAYGYEPYSAKPVFIAMANWNRLMTDAKDSHSLDNSKQDATLAMWQLTDQKGQKVTLAWNDDESFHNRAFKVNTDKVKICDVFGTEYETKTVDGVFNYPLTADPIYIIGDYTEIDIADNNVYVSDTEVETALDDTFSVYVNNNSGKDATIEVTPPENLTLTEKTDFDENGMARLTFKVGNQKAEDTKIRVKVLSDEGETVLLNQGIDITYVGSVATSILSKYFRSNRWTASIVLKNTKRTDTVSGVIKVTEPSFMSKEIRFENIKPQTSKELSFNIPDSLLANNVFVKAEVRLDSGEVYNEENSIYFSSFTRTKKPPVIDGKADDEEWNLNTPFVIRYKDQVVSNDSWSGEDDLSGNVYFMYDNDNLYMYAEVKDDVFCDKDEQGRIWSVDSIQFAFTTARETGGLRTEFSVGSINGKPSFKREAFMGVDTGMFGVTDKENFEEDTPVVEVKRDENKKITYYEMRMPWKYIYSETEGNPYAKRTLYFSMLINENDGAGRQGWMEFCPGIGYLKDPSQFREISIK